MSKETINIGTSPNDGTGDSIRDGAIKINNNFAEIYGVDGLLKAGGTNIILKALPDVDYVTVSLLATKADSVHTHTHSQITDFTEGISNNTEVTANTTHRGSDGSDHTFIDQSVISGASPTFYTANFTSSTNKNLITDALLSVLNATSGTNTGDQLVAYATTIGLTDLDDYSYNDLTDKPSANQVID
jgi:hypothetical protein